MRKNLAIAGGIVLLALAVSFGAALAEGSACAGMSKAGGAAKGSCCVGDKATKASMTGGTCTAGSANCCPFDKAAFEKQAPGSKMVFETTASGASLTISAGGSDYVAAVQMVAANSFEKMKTELAAAKTACMSGTAKGAASSCPMHSGAAGASSGTCTMKGSTSKASMTTSSPADGKPASCPDMAGMKGEKASASCATSGASGQLCETVKTGMCCADCSFEKTADGVRITWTSTKPEVVKAVQAAATHMKTCMSGSMGL